MVSREYRRVRMRLPARLRWTTPLGQKIELVETRDVSRGGLLLSSRELHAPGVPLWVTFPYDVSLPDGQPEVLARVVRCITSREDSHHIAGAREKTSLPGPFVLAIHFEQPAQASNGNHARREPERRGSPRRMLAVPIRVRPEPIPWFEETMSLDFSLRGLRFRSQREYAEGQVLKIILEEASSASWPGSGEFRARVVRVCPATGGVALDVAVCRAT